MSKNLLFLQIYFILYSNRCSRLRKANDDYRQQSLLNNPKEQEQQIDLLRQMIRASEETLLKERAKIQKLKAKKEDHYKIFIAQVCF
jgi:hypothetical protein